MNSNNNSISDLENLIAESICLKIEKWNLYLGDAGLARKLAIECLSNISKGIKNAVEIALESVQVSIGVAWGMSSKGKLSSFEPDHIFEKPEELFRFFESI